MLTVTWSLVCDLCGKNAHTGSAIFQPGEEIAVPLTRPNIFGNDACGTCLERTREAMDKAFPDRPGPWIRTPH